MTVIPPDIRLRRTPGVPAQQLDDSIVMFSVELGRYFGLSGVGRRIWELLDEPRPATEIIEALLREYEVEPAHCETEALAFLAELEEAGLVERQPS